MKFIKRALLIFLTFSLVAACNANDGDKDTAKDNDKVTQEDKDNNLDNNTDKDADMNNDHDDNDMKMNVSNEAQDKIEKLDNVEDSYVIVTDHNAYVAVDLKDASNNEVSKDVEDKISTEVKSIDNNIENVYVSSNPDFINSMKDYGNKIEAGDPIEGFFTEFSDMVKRIFPNAK